jgi:diguanylate cyclase (GGDEF)-like protein
MFDVRSLLIVLLVTDVVLAASLWIGTARARGDGIRLWASGLVLQAVGVALLASRGALPDVLGIVLANALVAASLSLAAGAISAFRHAPIPNAVHAAFAILVALVSFALMDDNVGRTFAASLLYGSAMLVATALVWNPLPEVGVATRGLFIASFLLGAASFFARAIAVLAAPEAVAVLLKSSPFQTVFLISVYSTVLASSVSFLLMQKERADHLVQQLASTDPLTGAFNRRVFMEVAEKELSRARRFNAPVSLVLLDLDHFKRVNDTHGHLVGDRVLQRFADIVRDQLRKEDILVRYGGEEFCVLLPDVPGPGAVALAGRIRKAVASAPFAIDGHRIVQTTSAGVAARIDEGPEGLDRLIARADEALYIAKSRGRNRVAAVSLGRSRAA